MLYQEFIQPKKVIIFKPFYKLLISFFFVCPTLFSIQLQAATIQGNKIYPGFEFEDSHTNLKGYSINKEIEGLLRGFEVAEILETPDKKSQPLIKEGQYLLRLGEREQGINLIKKAWEVNPGNERLGVYLGGLYIEQKDYENALDVVKQINGRFPDSIMGYKLEGMIYIQQQNMDQARVTYLKALDVKPGIPDVSHNLALFALMDGDVAGARLIYQNSLKFYPNSLSNKKYLALLELKSGSFEKVIELLSGSVEKYPKEKSIQIIFTKAALALGDNFSAVKVSNDALKNYPEDVELLILNSMGYFFTGNFDKAIFGLEKVRLTQPVNPTALLYLARSYESKRNFSSALVAVDQILEQKPDNVIALFLKARILAASGKYNKAFKIIESLRKTHPNDASLPEFQAKLAILKSQPERAIDYLKQAFIIDASSYYAIRLAGTQLNYHEKKAGIKTLTQWLEKNPDDILARSVLAETRLSSKEYALAINEYKKILQQKPNSPGALNNLAWIQAEQGNDSEAYNNIIKANEFLPNNPQILDTYSEVLIKMNKKEEAKILFKKAILESPNNAQLYYFYAKLLFQIGDYPVSKTNVNIALAMKSFVMNRKQAEILSVNINKEINRVINN